MSDSKSLSAAEAALKAGKRDEARHLYDKMIQKRVALDVEPRLAAIAHALGLADAAVEHMRRASQARPADAALLGNLGALLNTSGKREGARRCLQEGGAPGAVGDPGRPHRRPANRDPAGDRRRLSRRRNCQGVSR